MRWRGYRRETRVRDLGSAVRGLIEIQFPTSPRVKFIIPVSVELVSMERQGVHLRIHRRHSFRVLSLVELSSDPKPCIGALSRGDPPRPHVHHPGDVHPPRPRLVRGRGRRVAGRGVAGRVPGVLPRVLRALGGTLLRAPACSDRELLRASGHHRSRSHRRGGPGQMHETDEFLSLAERVLASCAVG